VTESETVDVFGDMTACCDCCQFASDCYWYCIVCVFVCSSEESNVGGRPPCCGII